MAETAALVVALSAQLTKFEKDMKQAVTIADQHTKQIETTFTRMNVAIEGQLSGFANRAAAGLGPVGGVLGALGPIGLTVAASIGVLAGTFVFLSNKVDQFTEKARALKDLSESTGLTVNELKALGETGLKVGLDFEQTERFITRLAVAVQELRTRGTGPLFDVLLKIRPELTSQVAGAKDLAEAINILASAFLELNKSEQLQLSTAIAGRRNITSGRLLGAVGEAGGVSNITAEAKKAGKAIDEELTAKIVKLDIEIQALKKQTEDVWGRMFSEEIKIAEKETAERLLQMALSVERIKNAGGFLQAVFEAESIVPRPPAEAPRAKFAERFAPVTEKPLAVFGPTEQAARQAEIAAENEAAALQKRKDELATTIERQRRYNEALGDGASQSDILKLKTLELEKAGLDNKDVTEAATRGLSAYTLQLKIGAEAIRERLGIASEEEIKQGKLNQLALDRIKIGLTENEVLQATNLILKEAKELSDQLEVRRAYLPGLKQLELDAASVRKGFDQLAVNSLNTLGDGFADIILKTKTLSQAFKSMTDSILRDLLRLLFRQAISGPLAGLLQPSGGGGFASLFAPAGKQSGGPVSGGRAYVVGEHGPELFVPQSAGHIMPNAVSTGRSAGGTNVEINNYVAADTETKQTRQEGPNGERIIIDIVKKAQARGQLDDVNRGRFALRPAKVR